MNRDSEHSGSRPSEARHRGRRSRPVRQLAEVGQSLVELAFVVPILLLLVLGILEVSRLLETQHILSTLTREGANLASRGTPMGQAVATTRDNQEASGLGDSGGVIVSRLLVGTDGIPRIEAREASAGAPPSRIGGLNQPAGPYVGAGLLQGQTYFVVEMEVPYTAFTPFSNFLEIDLVPEELYDRSLF